MSSSIAQVEMLIIVIVAVIAVVGAVIAAGTARTGRRSGGGVPMGVAGSFDEIFAPARHEAQLERQRRDEVPAPAPVPGDPMSELPDGFAGRIRIHV